MPVFRFNSLPHLAQMRPCILRDCSRVIAWGAETCFSSLTISSTDFPLSFFAGNLLCTTSIPVVPHPATLRLPSGNSPVKGSAVLVYPIIWGLVNCMNSDWSAAGPRQKRLRPRFCYKSVGSVEISK